MFNNSGADEAFHGTHALAASRTTYENQPCQVTKRKQLETNQVKQVGHEKTRKRHAAAAAAVEEDDEDGEMEEEPSARVNKLRKAKAGDFGEGSMAESSGRRGRGRGRAGASSGRGRGAAKASAAGRGRGRGRGKRADPCSERMSMYDGEDSKQAPDQMASEAESSNSEEESEDMDLAVLRKPAARVSSTKAKPATRAKKIKIPSEIRGDVKDTEEDNDSPVVDALTGRQTFAGRRQPANGMANLRWAVLRKCFIEHIYPHIHVNRSKHEDGLESG